MLGVVLWSSEARESAVIWCEDHGPVAYLKGRAQLWPAETPVTAPLRWPIAGDLVALDLGGSARVRLARRVRLVERQWRSQLPSDLLQMAPADLVSQDLNAQDLKAQDIEARGLLPTGLPNPSTANPSTANPSSFGPSDLGPHQARTVFGPFGAPPPGQGLMRPQNPAPRPADPPVMLRLVAQNPDCQNPDRDEAARPRRRSRPIDS